MVCVVVHLVVVDGQEVAVVVGVEAVRGVVVHLVPPPVSLLVAVRVHTKVIVVDVRVVDVAVDVNLVEQLGITEVLAEPSNLMENVVYFSGLVKFRLHKPLVGGGFGSILHSEVSGTVQEECFSRSMDLKFHSPRVWG